MAILSGCAGSGNSQSPPSHEGDRPPNFVIVFSDDQGYADVGVYGAVDIRTPHLDRMASEGLRFTRFYDASPVCTPSRAALLTGCYPKRIGLAAGVLWPGGTTGLNPREVTLAEILKDRGYATACIGKWHLGRPTDLLPLRQGFDTYFGVPYSNDMTPDHILSLLGADFPPLPLMRDEEVIEEGVDQSTLTSRYTREALRFIRENRDRPFFLYLAHNMPHYPCHSSPAFEDPTVNDNHRGVYASAVEEVDWSVGQILEELAGLGLDESTLVIFTSDNGPWKLAETLYGEVTGSALPLRGWKGETWEGGMRVPAIMRWPGRLPAGARCDRLAGTIDLVPTLAGYAGAQLPAGPEHKTDGMDVSALLEDPEGSSPHDYFYYYDGDTGLLEAVSDAEGWKLHLRKDLRIVEELYFLAEDIAESRDLFRERPDVVNRLREAAEAFDAEITANARPVGEGSSPQ
jgi:arylsulfatase A